MNKKNNNGKEVVFDVEFEKINKEVLSDKVLLMPLFILGIVGVIKTGAWGIAFLGYCCLGIQSGSLDYSFWWIVTIPFLFLIKIPEIFKFLNSWMEEVEKFIDRLF